MSEAFESAAYYDWRPDSEVLSHTEIEEALTDAFESSWEKDKTPQELLGELCPIEIWAFKRKEVSPKFAAGVVERWMEDFDEDHWCEEYGNFEDESHPWKAEDSHAIVAELTAVLQKYVDKAHVWQCEQVATRTFTEEEVKALIPEWFEESG
jgi:hypothetical protein